MIEKPIDIFGNKLMVGDKVAWGESTSTRNSCIYCGEILSIDTKEIQTHIKVKITHAGDDLYYKIGSIRTFIYPRNYFNLVRI